MLSQCNSSESWWTFACLFSSACDTIYIQCIQYIYLYTPWSFSCWCGGVVVCFWSGAFSPCSSFVSNYCLDYISVAVASFSDYHLLWCHVTHCSELLSILQKSFKACLASGPLDVLLCGTSACSLTAVTLCVSPMSSVANLLVVIFCKTFPFLKLKFI